MMSFETWSDHEGSGRGKGGWITDVVEMMVRPDDSGDIGTIDTQAGVIGVKDLGDVLLGLHGGGCFDELHRAWGVVFPVAADTEVEEYVLLSV